VASQASAFDLKIPASEMAWAREQAKSAGARLLDDGEGGQVWLGARLPASMAPFAKAQAPKEPAKAAKWWALSVPFAMRAVAQSQGARWVATSKSWMFHGAELPEGLTPFEAPAMSWEALAQRAANGEASGGWKARPGEKMLPRPHQEVASKAIEAAALAGLPGFLLSDEVGLGKTISAWNGAQKVAKALGAKSMVIVAPLSVLAHWRACAARMDNEVETTLAINYDRLEKLFELPEGAKVKTKKGLARKAQAAQIDLVIFDESHKLKNPQAARSKLAAKLADNAKFCLYLSATAGQNPLELSYLGKLIAKATGAPARSTKDFEAWCQTQGFGLKKGAYGALEWGGDQEDCVKLRKILFEGKTPAGMRRRPEEIAGWPAISRGLVAQPLDAQARALYQAEWAQFKKAWEAGKAAAPSGKAARAAGLVQALRFRQKSSLLRVGATVEWALDLAEQGVKPVISCAFKASAAALEAGLVKGGLRCVVIDGSQSASEREAARKMFQTDGADVAVFTIEEGISLHEGEMINPDKPRALLVHDLRWSAIQMAQIEGRAHRDGKFAQAHWLAGEGTIEFEIAKRVAARTVAMRELSGDVQVSLDEEIMREIEAGEGPWRQA
jgi:hypothetical protein